MGQFATSPSRTGQERAAVYRSGAARAGRRRHHRLPRGVRRRLGAGHAGEPCRAARGHRSACCAPVPAPASSWSASKRECRCRRETPAGIRHPRGVRVELLSVVLRQQSVLNRKPPLGGDAVQRRRLQARCGCFGLAVLPRFTPTYCVTPRRLSSSRALFFGDEATSFNLAAASCGVLTGCWSIATTTSPCAQTDIVGGAAGVDLADHHALHVRSNVQLAPQLAGQRSEMHSQRSARADASSS